jgi:Holliday-junction resolvase-like of SPT6
LNALRNFIAAKKPHAVVIGGEARDAMMVKADLADIINQLIDEEQFPNIPIEIADNQLAKIYSNSNKGRVRIKIIFRASHLIQLFCSYFNHKIFRVILENIPMYCDKQFH